MSLFLKRRTLRKLELSITYDCQCNCSKCSSYKLKNNNHRELNIYEIKNIFNQAYALGVFQVNLIGGEPLLRKDIIDIIKCLRTKTTFISISTNGVLLTKTIIKKLKEAGLDLIKISLDSPDEKEHDNERQYPGLFNNIMEVIQFIKKEGLLCELTTVATKEILRSGKIWKLVQMCKDKRVIFGLTIPAVCGRWSNNFDILLDKEDIKILERITNHSHVIRDTQTGLFRSQCSAGKEQVYITAYGDVLPCSVVHISFGNIRNTSLEKIWLKIISCKIFKKSQDFCLAGEDRDFINKYLKPINQIKNMPVPIEYFSF